ncbi:MAG: ribosome silencing factor [Chloroflexi bacterium]|nr:ribosome silencing factor [Chloroflexota bacterium]|tara:strand:- start:5874 stop:6251 length:378 start_codon:yes stop_codon:yes gene_type:complete
MSLNQEKIRNTDEEFKRANSLTDILADKQVADILLLDLRALQTFADFFIIGTVDNIRQAKTVVDLISKQKKELGASLIKQDGGPESDWILLDVSGVVIHLFNKETREYYDLESLWSSAKTILRIH